MARKLLLSIVIASMTALGCGKHDMPLSQEFEEEVPLREPAAGLMAAKVPAPAQSPAPRRRSASQQPVPVPNQRRIIRHGNLSLEVKSVEEALAEIKSRVESIGGYISSESMSEDPYARRTGSISCRVPSEELDETLEELKALGKVENVSVNADDITDQYFDLEIRIANQKRLEKRLLDLLERQTKKLSDLLEIERELARVRNDIDSMEGRKRLWDNQVAFSTLVVNVHEPLPAIASEEGGALRTLLRSFSRAGNNFVLTIAGIIAASGAIVPIAAVLLFAIWLIMKFRRRRKKETA